MRDGGSFPQRGQQQLWSLPKVLPNTFAHISSARIGTWPHPAARKVGKGWTSGLAWMSEDSKVWGRGLCGVSLPPTRQKAETEAEKPHRSRRATRARTGQHSVPGCPRPCALCLGDASPGLQHAETGPARARTVPVTECRPVSSCSCQRGTEAQPRVKAQTWTAGWKVEPAGAAPSAGDAFRPCGLPAGPSFCWAPAPYPPPSKPTGPVHGPLPHPRLAQLPALRVSTGRHPISK